MAVAFGVVVGGRLFFGSATTITPGNATTAPIIQRFVLRMNLSACE
jgi:hypothetical protein